MDHVIVYTDGGARGNPGPAGIGVVVLGSDGAVLKEIARYIGKTTNNVAEYQALIEALEALKVLFGEKLRDMQVEVRMDSELLVRQLSGIYKVKDPTLKEKFGSVASLRMSEIPNITFIHIPREKNAHADRLVNKAIDAVQK